MADSDLTAANSEFGFIAQHLRPLASGHQGALELTDDAALIEPTSGMTSLYF